MTKRITQAILNSIIHMLAAGALCAADLSLLPYNVYDGINPGGRSIAMGGAGLCSARDASSIYINPATLVGSSNKMLVTFKMRQTPKEIADRSDILGGRSVAFLGFMGNGMGIAWQPMANLRESLSPGTTVEAKVNRLTMAFSNNVAGPVDFGMNINYYTGFMGVSSAGSALISDANGYSIDWGITYKAHPNITLAADLLNAPGSVRWGSLGSDNPPVISRTGARVKLPGLLTIAAESETRKYKRPRDYDGKKTVKIYHAGIEQNLMNLIFLRAGISGEDLNNTRETGYSAGLGWKQGNTNIDLTWKEAYAEPTDKKYLQSYYFSISAPF